MYVFIIQDNNQTDYSVPVTDVVGPFDTYEQAEKAARNWFRDLDEIDDFSMVREYTIKPIRSYEKSVRANTSWSYLWQRIYNRGFLDEVKW